MSAIIPAIRPARRVLTMFLVAGLLVAAAGARAEQNFELSALPADELRRQDLKHRLPFTPTFKTRWCLNPKPTGEFAIDVDRSLFVHDRATLDSANFSLQRTFGQLATQAGALVPGLNATSVFRQFWDTQNAPPGAASGPHCSTTLNGYPLVCPRFEGNQANGTDAQVLARMQNYRVIALVNRLDLAHEGWRNCGEYRIVYGRIPVTTPVGPDPQRALIIFEAVLPNPKPGCRTGCVAVAKFWKSLSSVDDPAARGALLEKFFYGNNAGGSDVLPGFRPVVHIDHYSASGVSGSYGGSGSGQIRTNQFDTPPWMLREFRTALTCFGRGCSFNIVQIPVKVSPFGRLWNEDLANTANPLQSRAQNFQGDVLAGIPQLASPQLMQIGYSVAKVHDSGESLSQPFFNSPEQYRHHFDDATGATTTFRTAMAAGAAAHSLTATQLVNRANTQSCHGCHRPQDFGLRNPNAIGNASLPGGGSTTVWPAALSFVHVETVPDPNLFLGNPVFGAGAGQAISPALQDVFLPARKQFLLSQLNAPACPCRGRFAALPDTSRFRAERAIDDLDLRFDPRIAPLTREINAALRAGKPEDSLREQTQALNRLQLELDQEAAARLRKLGITPVVVRSEGVEVIKLDAVKAARSKDRVAPDAIQARVLELANADPPRRTVTGSFSPH